MQKKQQQQQQKYIVLHYIYRNNRKMSEFLCLLFLLDHLPCSEKGHPCRTAEETSLWKHGQGETNHHWQVIFVVQCCWWMNDTMFFFANSLDSGTSSRRRASLRDQSSLASCVGKTIRERGERVFNCCIDVWNASRLEDQLATIFSL